LGLLGGILLASFGGVLWNSFGDQVGTECQDGTMATTYLQKQSEIRKYLQQVLDGKQIRLETLLEQERSDFANEATDYPIDAQLIHTCNELVKAMAHMPKCRATGVDWFANEIYRFAGIR